MKPPKRSPLGRFFGRVSYLLPRPPEAGAHHHFVRDYARLVRKLKADYALDDAMSLAVGGDYAETGARLAEAVIEVGGLKAGERILDLGCGSGRLSTALARRIAVDYTGIDVVPDLLDYARKHAPADYRFVLNRELGLPCADDAFDVMAAFSLFTHLAHEETYLYLAEARRVLAPGGRLVMSFLEFAEPVHWGVFEQTFEGLRRNKRGHANVFIERAVLTLWAQRLGFDAPSFIGPGDAGAGGQVGQSVAVFRKP